MKAPGNPVPAQLHDGREGLGVLVGPDEIKIGLGIAFFRVEDALALVDPVGVDDDQAVPLLAEDLIEADDRHPAALDQVPQEGSRSKGGQLILVADDDEPHGRRDRPDQAVHQRQVDHRELVEDDRVPLEGTAGIAAEAAGFRVVLQRPVDGLGLPAGRLGKPLGRPAGGGG